MSDLPEGSKPIRVGVYSSLSNAEKAYRSLEQAGFTIDELSVLCSSESQQKHFPSQAAENIDDETLPKAVAAGSAVGALIGGATAATGLVTVAGVPIVVAGALTGVLGGGIVGGLVGAMIERGLEAETADYYDQSVTAGKILIAVDPLEPKKERLDLAEHLLRDAGAEPLSLLDS